MNGIVRVREKTALENMLRSSERCYEMSREHIAIINRKCHDLKHQLRALERAGEEDRAEYIREARESVDFYQTLVYTGNEALNTILAEKGLFCRDKGILFRCSVDEADLSFIRLPDLLRHPGERHRQRHRVRPDPGGPRHAGHQHAD